MAIWLVVIFLLLIAGPMLNFASGRASLRGDWRTASDRSSGLAPDPVSHPEAIVQVYAGRAFSWRGAFSDHMWLAVKPQDADRYTRYEVVGWFRSTGHSVVSVSDQRAPDAEWYGAAPRVIRDVRGPAAEVIIAKLPGAITAYPFGETYTVWPGPNSNTFLAYIGRAIPELRLTLPSTAVGKDYLPISQAVSRTPSGDGIQLSLYGVLGVLAGRDEGLELNVLGLVTGIDIARPALKLPGIGRVPGNARRQPVGALAHQAMIRAVKKCGNDRAVRAADEGLDPLRRQLHVP